MKLLDRLTDRYLVLVLIIFNWSISGYLVYYSSQLRSKSDVVDWSKIIFKYSSAAALKTSLSLQLGFPLAGWGFACFGLLGLLISINKKALDMIAGLVAAFVTGIGLVLSGLIIKAGISCPLCLFVHGIQIPILLFIALLLQSGIKGGYEASPFSRIKPALMYVLLGLSVIMGAVTETLNLKSTFGQKSVDYKQVWSTYLTEPIQNVSGSATIRPLGSPTAPVHLVVFSSFQCPSCKVFATSLKELGKKYGDHLRISFKNFPLSESCNPRLIGNTQPRSCQAALAALAANNQHRFWEYHDLLFQSDLAEDEAALLGLAQKAGLDINVWEHDRKSDTTMNQLQEDINLGNALNTNATPTVFINGRHVTNFQEQALDFIIENELKRNKQ